MVTILSALFVLGVLIFVHELGHFIVAKLSGIKVEKFSLGFPPTAISKKIGDTEYCLSWIPLGGYVKMAGDDPSSDEIKGEPWEFLSKPTLIKMAVVFAGPFMNFVFAFIVYWAIFTFSGQTVTQTTRIDIPEQRTGLAQALSFEVGDSIIAINNNKVNNWQDILELLTKYATDNLTFTIIRQNDTLNLKYNNKIADLIQKGDIGIYPLMSTKIDQIQPSSPAAKAGLKEGDIIVEIDSTPVESFFQLKKIISHKPNQKVHIKYKRNNIINEVDIITDAMEVSDKYGKKIKIGILGIIGHLPFEKIKLTPIAAIKQSFVQINKTIDQMLSFIKKLITRKISTKYMGGPIYIVQLSGKMAKAGLESLFNFMALISLNLGLINLFPIPMLDGGYLLIFAIEGITRKKLSLKQQSIIQYIGFAFLILLTVLVMYNDIIRLIK